MPSTLFRTPDWAWLFPLLHVALTIVCGSFVAGERGGAPSCISPGTNRRDTICLLWESGCIYNFSSPRVTKPVHIAISDPPHYLQLYRYLP